ncbi:IS66 family transposase [Roseomonas sp. CCTCC AB2023176]|uniref:IS66 family transposase n=1 Tax=Roseomonas sp. CCTCC AB2023176 TaxID=3342640 RepID=UPI0035DF2AC8
MTTPPDERGAETEEVLLLRAALAAAEARIAHLESMLHAANRARFGASTERVDPGQLALSLGREPPPPPPANDAPRREGGGGRAPARRNRGSLPPHLERVERVVDLPSRACPCCGRDMHRVGEDRSERLDVVPARLRVLVTIRPRLACRGCARGVHQAPAPEHAVARGLPTEALLAHVLVAKYGDGLPLYRQAGILRRSGVTLDRSTLCDWVGAACWWLRPLYERVLAHVRGQARVFVDDTPLPTLERGLGRTRKGALWAYAVDDRPWAGRAPPAVAYFYAPDRKGERPAAHLRGFRGTLQVDGYDGFKAMGRERRDGSVVLACCWAHLRRRFFEVHAGTKSPVAAEALLRIGEFYNIEREIRGRPAEERLAARRERSAPRIAALETWMRAQLDTLSRGSKLAEHIRYGLRHWSGPVRFLDDGTLELDTNTVEREIRPVAVTRKAALFAGSEGGGANWAVATTLVRTALMHGRDPEAWLTAVLEQVVRGEVRATNFDTLLPWHPAPGTRAAA